ncbi:MAG TPA: hypothetical protein DEP53_01310 [Bacteroidetes bacterium]|nr:hypothetical protein [Bacteroidota bacterium]
MNRRIVIGFFAVLLATQTFEGLINFFVLGPIYSQGAHLWRPIAEVKFWMLPFTGLFFSFFFTFIFSKGYEKRGIGEGLRYGFYVAMMVSLPHAYGSYALMQIPYSVALQWFVFGSVEFIVAGIILAIVFKSGQTTQTD